MNKINVFVENIYENYEFDEVKAYNDAIKITDFLFSQDEVMNNSCLAEEEYEQVFFDIVFMNNEEIHKVNCEYRNKDCPTDVITFALFADSEENERFIFDGEINLGEILISLDKTQEQAYSNNHSFGDELFFLISHGIMHLLGFDHLSKKELIYMLENQQKSMEKVNVKIYS